MTDDLVRLEPTGEYVDGPLGRLWKYREIDLGAIRIEFAKPADLLLANDRPHWSRRARLTRIWRTTTALHAHRTLGPGRAKRAQPPSYVRVTFPVTVNRRRDADGPAPTTKAIVDGLVDAGVWPDDTPEWVETLGSRFAKGAELVVVEIIPREVAA